MSRKRTAVAAFLAASLLAFPARVRADGPQTADQGPAPAPGQGPRESNEHRTAEPGGPRRAPQAGPEEPRTPAEEHRRTADVERRSSKGVAPSPEAGPAFVRLEAIDPDALASVQRLLALRALYDGPIDGHSNPALETALRAYTSGRRLEVPSDEGSVSVRALDQLGAGREVAKRWGSNAPRAPELTPEEILRVNFALGARGYRTDGRTPLVVDVETIDALRSFQRDTGHPVQLGNYVDRRWLFILGVATPESGPLMLEGTVPAGAPRAAPEAPARRRGRRVG